MIKRLKELREDHDFTQQHIADMLHCSQRAYSNYESGNRNLPIDVLIKIAEIYQTSTDYILGVTDNKKRY